MTVVRCPVHERTVVVEDGVLLGRCDLCMEEAAVAISLIASGVARANAWAAGVLERYGKKTTGPGRAFLAEIAAGAREVPL